MLTASTVSMLVPSSSEHYQDCSVPANLAHLLQARASALEEFDSIMADSASSMKADAPLVTLADKTAWWRKRLELDQRMATLLQHLDEDWMSVFVLCLHCFCCPGLPIERFAWLMFAVIALIKSCDALLQPLNDHNSNPWSKPSCHDTHGLLLQGVTIWHTLRQYPCGESARSC